MSRFRNLTTAIAALMVAAPSLHAVELQSVAGTDTKLSVYGFVWVYANYYVDAIQNQSGYIGSLFYNNPAYSGSITATPLDTHGKADKQFLFALQPTRFGFASSTPSANLGDITTKIEYDLNGSNSHLRHANLKFGNWTFGQDWSLWADLDAGADTVDWAGPIGGQPFDTPRTKQIKYVTAIDKNNAVGLSLEQNDGQGDGAEGAGANAVGSTAGTSDYKIPTIIGMYTYTGDWGHVGFRAMGQNYGAHFAATATTGRTRYSKIMPAFALSGDVKIAKDSLVWNVYWGKGVGSYGPAQQAVVFNDATQTVTAYKNIGWTVGYTHNWTDNVRSNIILSGVTFSSDKDIAATQNPTPAGVQGAWKTGNSLFVNTFVRMAKNLQFGAEYAYEQAKPFATNGAVDSDGKPASKNSNSKISLAVKANF